MKDYHINVFTVTTMRAILRISLTSNTVRHLGRPRKKPYRRS